LNARKKKFNGGREAIKNTGRYKINKKYILNLGYFWHFKEALVSK
jgi:hypothetical protein